MTDTKLIQNKIIDAIKKFNVIILQRHQDPDPDAYGSQIGLAELIRNSFPKKHVYQVGSDDKGLDWIGKPQKISDATYKNALVFVTDCANRPRISNDIVDTNDNKNRFNTGKMLIKIDHHPNVDKFGDIQWVNPKASSASEMIVDLADSSSDLKMNAKSARALYAGIIGDIGRFMFPSTSAHTLIDTAKLAKFDFSMNEVNREETATTLDITHLYGYLDEHLHAFKNGVAYYTVTQDLIKKYHLNKDSFISKNIPYNIKGIIAWAMFTELPNGSYKVSLRSQGPAIDKLAMKYNGGGHALASGARVSNKEQANDLLKNLNDLVDSRN